MNKLEQLKQLSTIVADTGEIEEIKKYKPTDATTNPSLILAASLLPQYQPLISKSISWGKKQSSSKDEQISHIIDKLCVEFGVEILKVIDGRVSIEIDAKFSFDTEKSVEQAHRFIHLFEEHGINKKRILIKLASTWEGIQAAKHLEKVGIHCNMTLIFHLIQAVACATVKATLISPFVGRILDWYKKHAHFNSLNPSEDPGVQSVTSIYHYYKKRGYRTQIMAASFRTVAQILELAGCDLLTISPQFLQQLQKEQGSVERKLSPENLVSSSIEYPEIDEKIFRWEMCQSAMASEKLDEGIRNFNKDTLQLKKLIKDQLF